MPDTTPCPACGTDNPPDAGRCQVCDYELQAQLPGPPTAGQHKCSRCGSQVASSAPFCQVCGLRADQRLPRPPTGSLNVRAIFGPEAYSADAPVRSPVREQTELAPSAQSVPRIGVAQRFEAPPAQRRRAVQRTPLGTPEPYVTPAPVPQGPAPGAGAVEVPGSGSRSRRRPAPRPRPNYSGFDSAGDSGTAHTDSGDLAIPRRALGTPRPASGAPTVGHGPTGPAPAPTPAAPFLAGGPAPRAAAPGGHPGDSFGGTPRPRDRGSAYPEPSAPASNNPYSTHSSYSGQIGSDPNHLASGPTSGAESAYGASGSGAAAAWGQPAPVGHHSRLVLVGRDGVEGESFPLPAHGIEIGRQAGIAFPSDPFVSPRHAHLSPVDGGIHLTDLGSRNGIYLRLTEPAPVYPGDLFLLGNQLLRLDRLESSWSETPADNYGVRGFGSPVKPPWAVLVRMCVGEIEDDRYHLRGNEMIIGREDGEIVFPSDAFLSRQHARVRMAVHEQAMTVMLEDLGSANGTYLRTRGPVTVPFGGMFRVGDQIFRVRND